MSVIPMVWLKRSELSTGSKNTSRKNCISLMVSQNENGYTNHEDVKTSAILLFAHRFTDHLVCVDHAASFYCPLWKKHCDALPARRNCLYDTESFICHTGAYAACHHSCLYPYVCFFLEIQRKEPQRYV